MLPARLQVRPVWSSRTSVVAPRFQEVLAEIQLGRILGVDWKIDLTRPFVPFLSATDASTSFGFGIATAPFPKELLGAVARWSETQGAYVVLDSDGPNGTRLGPCLELDLRFQRRHVGSLQACNSHRYLKVSGVCTLVEMVAAVEALPLSSGSGLD